MKYIKNIILSVILIIISFFTFNDVLSAKEVNVYMFYGKTCPHCKEALKYLDSIKEKYDLKIYKYEVYENEENKNLMNDVANYMDINVRGVPFTIIDNTAIFGYASGTTDETYRYHIKLASKDEFIDEVGIKIGVVEKSSQNSEKQNKNNTEQNYKVKVPFFGKIDLKGLSLPVISVILGLIDGFNPCAMWVLLFLISTLIGMKDKKRLWIFGLTFLISSSVVYLAFMVSWLQFAKMISGVSIVRTIIAIVAIIGGLVNLNSYANSIGKDSGCDVVDSKKRKKIFSKIKKFTHEKSFFIALLGVIALAVSVNLIELACSAGLPVIFTQILAMNNLSGFGYWAYILIYIFFFMIDDLVVFAIAVKTMELSGISTKYSKYSHLVGGILMLLIGLLLIVKPEWLMFNF